MRKRILTTLAAVAVFGGMTVNPAAAKLTAHDDNYNFNNANYQVTFNGNTATLFLYNAVSPRGIFNNDKLTGRPRGAERLTQIVPIAGGGVSSVNFTPSGNNGTLVITFNPSFTGHVALLRYTAGQFRFGHLVGKLSSALIRINIRCNGVSCT